MNVSEKIGEEYKKWSATDKVFIKAPTGSGKSYFILHTLLKYVIEQNGRILYVVNRKVLKKQLEDELHNDVERELFQQGMKIGNIDKYITITTYQAIEQYILNGNFMYSNALSHNYTICVYDECHYFYNDSNFNTYTELSFDALRDIMDFRIQIFISATLCNLEKKITNRPPNHVQNPSTNYFRNFKTTTHSNWKYEIEADYSYIRLHALDNKEALKDIVVADIIAGKDKWLIFTDSIDDGKKLEKMLKNAVEKDKESEIVFIDAHYMSQEDSTETVSDIVMQKKVNRQVVIATAVIDNGISFHDNTLRKLVVMADTKESFIQMIGRKRTDGKMVDLYILKRNGSHFNQRLQNIIHLLEYARKYTSDFENLYKFNTETGQMVLYPYDVILLNLLPNTYYQQKILQDIISGDWLNSHGKLFYVVRGGLAMNSFSHERCMDLSVFYSNMHKAMKDDDAAFLREQAQWLGKSEDEVEDVLADIETKRRNQIKEAISTVLKKEIRKQENIELKMKIKDSLSFMVKMKGYEDEVGSERTVANRINNLMKGKERTLSKDDFNFFMEFLDFPYRMSKPNKDTFLIEYIEE